MREVGKRGSKGQPFPWLPPKNASSGEFEYGKYSLGVGKVKNDVLFA
jgi:hypothetical protein